MSGWSAAGLLAGGAAATFTAGRVLSGVQRRRSLRRQVDQLLQVPGRRYSTAGRMGPLPEPVARYFRFAGVRADAPAVPIRMEQEGEFRLGRNRWRKFTAVHHANPAAPGFVWDAAVSLLSGVTIQVQDSYLEGMGRLEARLAGIPLVRQANRTTLAAGELHRYLAEAVWNPASLRPEQGIIWEPLDRHSACATLTARGIRVSLEFLFDAAGRIVKAYTPERYRDQHGTAVATPWRCDYRDYIRLNRIMVPRQGEVTWLLPDGPLSYCRLRVASLCTLGPADAIRSAAAG